MSIKKVQGYKLKKEYPGSPMPGVTLVPDGKGGWVNKKFIGTQFEWRFPHLQHPETYFINNPEFWEPVTVEFENE